MVYSVCGAGRNSLSSTSPITGGRGPVGVLVAVGVCVGVAVGVKVAVGVGVAVDVAIGVGVLVGLPGSLATYGSPSTV